MARKKKNFLVKPGDKFGRWEVLNFCDRESETSKFKNKSAYWPCVCTACGARRDIRQGQLIGTDGSSVDPAVCKGCFDSVKHGMSNTLVYHSWLGMRARCYNPSHNRYHRYGGRGIKVCDRWNDDFKAFYKDMGDPPTEKHSIDRINLDGDYEPNNCRWATSREQARNASFNRMLTHEGRTMCMKDWADEAGIKYQSFKARLDIQGLSMAEALTKPITYTGTRKRRKPLPQ